MAVIHCHSSKVFLEHCASLGATVCTSEVCNMRRSYEIPTSSKSRSKNILRYVILGTWYKVCCYSLFIGARSPAQPHNRRLQ